MDSQEIMAAYLVALSLGIGIIVLFRKFWWKPTVLRSLAINISITLYSVLLVSLMLELFLFTFFVKSQEYGYTWSGTRWFEKYWTPINSSGYRDPDYSDADVDGNGIIFSKVTRTLKFGICMRENSPILSCILRAMKSV